VSPAIFLAKGRKIEKVKRGEYLAVMSAGAYGMSMSSNYNSRPKASRGDSQRQETHPHCEARYL